MKTSESIKEIAGALLKAQKAIKAAIKDANNPHFKSKYADLSSVIDAVKAPLNDNSIIFTQGVGSNDNGVTVETMLLHVSGEWISETLTVPVQKNDAQGVGSAITYGRRYGLQALCGVPAEDDDGNAATKAAPASAKSVALDVWDHLDTKVQQRLLAVSQIVLEHMEQGSDEEAMKYVHSQGLDAEEKIGLWSRFDSKTRTRLKKADEQLRATA